MLPFHDVIILNFYRIRWLIMLWKSFQNWHAKRHISTVMSLLAWKIWWRNIWKSNSCLVFIVIELYIAEYKMVLYSSLKVMWKKIKVIWIWKIIYCIMKSLCLSGIHKMKINSNYFLFRYGLWNYYSDYTVNMFIREQTIKFMNSF